MAVRVAHWQKKDFPGCQGRTLTENTKYDNILRKRWEDEEGII